MSCSSSFLHGKNNWKKRMGLAKELKTGTKKSHSAAENTKFVSQFLKGVVSKDNYKTLISDFYFIYAALEEQFEILKTQDNRIRALDFPEVRRLESLKQDVRYYWGPNWRAIIAPSKACQQYVNRIREVGKDAPHLLVGHAYTRYMGDLSGGQILRGIAEKAMDLQDGEGLKFYDFDKIEDGKEFKEKYRSALDELPLDNDQVSAIITEANYAFSLNMQVFDEISGGKRDGWKSLIKVLLGFIRRSKV